MGNRANQHWLKWLGLIAIFMVGCQSNPPAPELAAELPLQPIPPISFAGSKQLSESMIRKELALQITKAWERGMRKADLGDLAFEVERLYRRKGWHFVETSVAWSPESKKIIINEGPFVVLGKINFQGNHKFDEHTLAEYCPSHITGLLGLGSRIFRAADLKVFTSALLDFYRDHGFLQAQIGKPQVEFSPDRKLATVTTVIQEGPQFLLTAIKPARAYAHWDETQTRLQKLVGKAWVPHFAFTLKSMVEEDYGTRGYPHASCTVRSWESGDGKATDTVEVVAEITLVIGPQIWVGDVLVKGQVKTRESFIRNRLLLAEGDLFNTGKVRESFHRLYKTGLFKSVDLQLKAGKDGQKGDLLIEVEETSTRDYLGEIGWGSYDLLRARVGLRERNFYGRGLAGRVELHGSVRGGKAIIGLTDPTLFDSEWVADLPLTARHREERSFVLQEIETRLRISRHLGTEVEIGATYRLTLSHTRDLDQNQSGNDESRYLIGAIGPFLHFDSRDDLFNPTKGWQIRLFAEVGSPFLGGEVSFLHGQASVAGYLSLSAGTILAARAGTEWVEPIGETGTIPIQERVFCGGENDLRSFNHWELGPKDSNGDPLGGRVKNLVSLEVRQHLHGNFSLAFFADYGNLAVDVSRPWRDFRPALGVGLRYGLPIGPIRLDLAFNPDRRNSDNEEQFILHFAIGLPF